MKTDSQIRKERDKILQELTLPTDQRGQNNLQIAWLRGAMHACNWVLDSHCKCCGKRLDSKEDDGQERLPE